MFYRKRIRVAVTVSLLLHIMALLPLIAYLLHETPGARTAQAKDRPIVLSLNDPLPFDKPPSLIDSGAAAEGLVQDSDLISSADSQAQDLSDAKGETNQPHFEEASEFDELGTPPTPPPGETPGVEVTLVVPLESDEKSAEEPVELEETALEPDSETPAEADDAMQVAALPPDLREQEPVVELMQVDAAPEKEETEEPKKEPERIEIAQAPPQPTIQAQELRSDRGREGGGAEKSGFTSFEATQHVLGEYMIEVRRKVRQQWIAALGFRYLGAGRAESLVECSIRPDGTLEYVRIVDKGESMSYAIICRDAIEKAGPFGPFPFDVPDIYRKENLEIVWKFSYL